MARLVNTCEKEERETKMYLNRMARTINTRVQNNIFPQWRSHKSLQGWSCMSFPSVLKNRKELGNVYSMKQPVYSGEFSNLRLPVTTPPLTQRRPMSHEQEIKAVKIATEGGYAEAFLNKMGRKHGAQLMADYRDAVEENQKMKTFNKFSSGMLTTYTYEERREMTERMNKKSEDWFSLRPNTAALGPNVDPLKSRKVKQLDEIHLDNEESDEDEETYAYKVKYLVIYRDCQEAISRSLPCRSM
eukprot:TRINITY_DN12795_c0_g3_i4.p1 TRINITY_DN12795_c0_g3~~TRINITY_DN12795_c0_g3_i4.p1  ORF type:complete len:244 (+),score=67.86 TRINITY_DN12795_c0_g3_i4:42-773(+)